MKPQITIELPLEGAMSFERRAIAVLQEREVFQDFIETPCFGKEIVGRIFELQNHWLLVWGSNLKNISVDSLPKSESSKMEAESWLQHGLDQAGNKK